MGFIPVERASDLPSHSEKKLLEAGEGGKTYVDYISTLPPFLSQKFMMGPSNADEGQGTSM